MKILLLRNKGAIQSSGAVPALKQIQNFVYNYRRSKLKNTDIVEQMEEIAAEARLSDELPDPTPFTFGYPLNEDGSPPLGDGSYEDPLVIGITTKFLLKSPVWGSNTFVFRMDTTFKLVTCAYPLIVCGISDAARQFYPMTFFITSQRTVVQYRHALRSRLDIFKTVVGRDLVVRYSMGDAEDAQLNAAEQKLAVSSQASTEPSMDYLMCFFHVVENVKKRISGLSNNSKYPKYRLIYEMHHYRDATELADVREKQIRFGELSSSSKALRTTSPAHGSSPNVPSGSASGPRPAVYLTDEGAVDVPPPIDHPSRLCTKAKPSTTPIARTKQLIKAKKVVVSQAYQSVQFLLEGSSGQRSEYQVRSWLDLEENAKTAAEGERNNHRMEQLDQPLVGWTVDLGSSRCECRAFYKFGACVHLLPA